MCIRDRFPVADLFYVLRHLRIGLYILFPAQESRQFDETAQRPVMQEGNEGAFAAAQIQAVVPVSAKSLADPGAAHLSGAEIQYFFPASYTHLDVYKRQIL